MTHQFEAQYVIKKYDNLLIVLPHTRCIVNTHFRIIPIRHVSDSTCLDFEVSREIQDVFNQLCISLSKNVHYFVLKFKKKIPIFIETFYDVTKRVHMNIDGFIFDENFISDFKIFFKKAIIESDQEWSDHKKLILLKGSKVSDKVPRGFPFFCVTFGNEESYIHIIEDKKRFPKTFGLEILGGYFDADPTIWLHPNSDTEQSIKDRAKIMSELFSQLDF
ncbi:hypothetical protein HZS_4636 [Henneguya salminicola]|nr:hypothetical protein HZS_4636 [Henneguya salminicola]